jgi:hypothetical protein
MGWWIATPVMEYEVKEVGRTKKERKRSKTA